MKKYYLQDTRQYVGNAMLFWRKEGTKTRPMTAGQLIAMDRRRANGEYVFLSVEVVV